MGGTAEEMFVDLVRKFQISYRDLPFNLYQFSTKFRDEIRARGGLLRVREFVMKDAYSFHASEADFKKEYDKMAETYTAIFKRLGLETMMVAADNGYIGGEYCHEFCSLHPEGESTFLVSSDGKYVAHVDVAEFVLPEVNPQEEIKKMEIIDQPEWVHTMEDNIKHYGKDKRFFLKNVVYRNRQGDVIIVGIRGDLEVNKTKVEQVLEMVGQLVEASDQDLADIGTKRGYVHSWGHKFVKPRIAVGEDRECSVIYVADNSLKTVRNFIGGQKEETTDSINVNYGRDLKHEIEADVALAQAGFEAPKGQGKLEEKKGIEVGNIFQLGYHYTNLMKGSVFTDEDGSQKPFYMGCYGIGLGRTMAAIVERFHDDRGIMWPEVVAPYQVSFISLENKELRIKNEAEQIYQKLVEAGIEVLWDDREDSAGIKFADADLLGCPVRLVISARTQGKIEWKRRTDKETELISVEEVLDRLKH